MNLPKHCLDYRTIEIIFEIDTEHIEKGINILGGAKLLQEAKNDPEKQSCTVSVCKIRAGFFTDSSELPETAIVLSKALGTRGRIFNSPGIFEEVLQVLQEECDKHNYGFREDITVTKDISGYSYEIYVSFTHIDNETNFCFSKEPKDTNAILHIHIPSRYICKNVSFSDIDKETKDTNAIPHIQSSRFICKNGIFLRLLSSIKECIRKILNGDHIS